MAVQPTVFVVDDDEAVRSALQLLLEGAGFKTELFADARAFLNRFNPECSGCLLLDVRMPGMSGLELQESLARRDIRLPVIVITGHGDVAMAVRAMKGGVMDFIEKPFSGQALLRRVGEALACDAAARAHLAHCHIISARLARLSPREREVMERVADGQYNKVIASALGISVSTVEAHRKKVMEKLEAHSLSELVRMLAYHRTYTGKPQ